MALLLPVVSWAADGEFDTPSQAFTWYSKGQGCIHLKLMTTNASPYRTLHEATYYLRDSQGTSTKVFYIGEKTSTNSGYVTSMYRNFLGSESLLYLTNDKQALPCGYLFLIPQTKVGLTLTVSYTVNGGNAESHTFDLTGSWKAGTEYIVNINMGTSIIQ